MSARRLTVVQVLPAMGSGGVERGTVEVAQALTRAGHRAVVVSSGGPMVAELTAAGAKHVTLPVAGKHPLTLRAVRPLRRLLRETGADILHARSRVPAWVCELARRKMPRPPRYITTVHGLYSVSRYSAVMTRGDAVIAVSEVARRYVLDHYPRVDPARVRVIHRGVDPGEFPHGYVPDSSWTAGWNAEFPHLAGKRLVTVVGRLTRLKGHAGLLRLIGDLQRRGVAAHGLIVGGEDPKRRAYARELKRSVDEAGLGSHITFTGHRADVREIAAVSDVVLSLSTKPESFGRSVLEALRLGTPVLGWDHGGVGEVLASVYPEGAVPLGDFSTLCGRAAELLTGPPVVVPLSPLFTKSAMLDGTLSLYEELTDG